MKKLLCAFIVLLPLIILCAADAEPKNCPYNLNAKSIHYQRMTPAQQRYFDDLYDAVRAGETKVYIYNLSREEAYMVTDTLFNECAELCALNKWTLYGRDIYGKWTPTYMELSYKRSVSEQDRFIREMASLAKGFNDVNDVYRYLCEKFHYSERSSATYPELMYAYECVKTGEAVCNGYAQSFAMLCHFAGFECSYIDGYGNGGRHAWNIMRVDGKYTLADCTWDDDGKKPKYRWFGLSTQEMNSTHTPDEEHSVLPQCVNVQGSLYIENFRTPAFDYSDLYFTLKQNDVGDGVLKVNRRLIELGYMSGSASRTYTTATKRAVKEFQAKNGIYGDSALLGVCTRLTQAALFSSAARGKYEDAVSPKSTVKSPAYTVYVHSDYGFTRSGNGGKMTFMLQNESRERTITSFTLRYWAVDSRGREVYIAREQNTIRVNLAPGERREFSFDIAADSAIRNAVTFKWIITELSYDNGEVFISNDLSNANVYMVASYNEPIG